MECWNREVSDIMKTQMKEIDQYEHRYEKMV